MYHLPQIASLLSARLHGEVSPSRPIEHLLTDSRQVTFPEASLFFALPGKRHDGHQYIVEAYGRGLRAFVVSRDLAWGDFPEASFLRVDDTLDALQRLTAQHRRRFDLPVIGITGSNGKTVTKEWLYQLLYRDYHLLRSPRSYNSQIGVPLSVWLLDGAHDLAVFEAGLSQPGEMEKLQKIIQPTIGLFTNIGPAHQEGFDSYEQKIREKLRLFRGVERLVYCPDDERVARVVAGLGLPAFTWSRRETADLQITTVEPTGPETIIRGRYRERVLEIRIPFTDEASVENAIHCWALLLYREGPEWCEARKERFAALESVVMRLELKEGINGCVLINDSYNTDLASLNIALQFLAQQQPGARHTLILSDILQSGVPADRLYQQVGRLIAERRVDRVIGIGPEVGQLADHLPDKIGRQFFPDTSAFLTQLSPAAFREEAILLKGARRFGFERIAHRLARRQHLTTLEVDLNALVHNLNVYARRLQPPTRIMAMVKAAAYGSGSLELARLLEFHKVAYLGVAYADEGVELRRGGVHLPILVLSPEEAVFENLLHYDLEPEIYGFGLLRSFARYVEARERTVPIHLKIDTGMHRLGFLPEELDELADLLHRFPQLKVKTIYSHLAASEDPAHDDYTHQQARLFETACEQLTARLGYRPWRHLLNSGGIERFPQYQADMVRLGIGLYGVSAGNAADEALQTVLRLKARIVQIRTLPGGASVSYGRSGRLDRDSRIATVSLGYADGLPRCVGNGRFALAIRGRRAPIVGSVCMDLCMVDVTDIPQAGEGDVVTVFGDHPRVEELARAAGTIPYEIFTGVAGRVRRLYVRE